MATRYQLSGFPRAPAPLAELSSCRPTAAVHTYGGPTRAYGAIQICRSATAARPIEHTLSGKPRGQLAPRTTRSAIPPVHAAQTRQLTAVAGAVRSMYWDSRNSLLGNNSGGLPMTAAGPKPADCSRGHFPRPAQTSIAFGLTWFRVEVIQTPGEHPNPLGFRSLHEMRHEASCGYVQ
jgi:hypothetical protein